MIFSEIKLKAIWLKMVSLIFFLISILNEELSSLFDRINKEKLETYITALQYRILTEVERTQLEVALLPTIINYHKLTS